MSDPSKTVVGLFLEMWLVACKWRPSIVSGVMRPDQSFNDKVKVLLAKDSDEAVSKGLRALLDEPAVAGIKKGRLLEVLREIDIFLYAIHPRALLHPAMAEMQFGLKHWSRRLKAYRRTSGCYLSHNGYKVVPRGPLVRLPRPEYASSATSFPDRFGALSVVPCVLTNDSVDIKVTHVSKSSSIVSGIRPGRRTGKESIAFIPVARAASDMILSQRTTSSSNFVDFRIAPTLDVPASLGATLSSIGHVDIAIAPELVVSTADSDLLISAMKRSPGKFRLLVAGTGHTEELENGQAWNEGRVVNSYGVVVWSQRKFWQAGIGKTRADELKLEFPTDGRYLLEDNASGEEITVADIDGFGRCVMLICQDVQSKPLSDELIRQFQPDWVFVPILDVSIEAGRWAHARTFELSALSPARFLVATSTTLAARLGKTGVACGLAVGPKGASEVDMGRQSKLAVVNEASGQTYCLVDWQEDWGKTVISIDE